MQGKVALLMEKKQGVYEIVGETLYDSMEELNELLSKEPLADEFKELEGKTITPAIFHEPITINSEEERVNCLENLAITNNDVAICDFLEADLKDECQETFVYAKVNTGETSLCDLLTSDEKKNQCLDFVYLNQAMNENNSSLCEQISDSNIKSGCLSEFGQQ